MRAIPFGVLLVFVASQLGDAAATPSIESTDNGSVVITIDAGAQLRLVTSGSGTGEDEDSPVVTLNMMLGYLDDMKRQVSQLSNELTSAKGEIKALREEAVLNSDLEKAIAPIVAPLISDRNKMIDDMETAAGER
jgi:hypothetical protein